MLKTIMNVIFNFFFLYLHVSQFTNDLKKYLNTSYKKKTDKSLILYFIDFCCEAKKDDHLNFITY